MFESLSHPAPPRLLELVAYGRNAMPEHFVDIGSVPNVGGAVGVPQHIVSGSLRRGWLAGCVGVLEDQRFQERLKAVNAASKNNADPEEQSASAP